jgi:hypothetical protein
MTITPTREGYLKPDGTFITLNAQQVIAKLHPHPPTYRRSPSIRVAIAKAASSPGWQPTASAYSAEESATIRAVMAQKFWQRIDVLHAPVHCIDHRDRAACSIDLLARTDKAELLVAAVHSAPYADLNPEGLAAELGAAIIMLGDARRAATSSTVMMASSLKRSPLNVVMTSPSSCSASNDNDRHQGTGRKLEPRHHPAEAEPHPPRVPSRDGAGAEDLDTGVTVQLATPDPPQEWHGRRVTPEHRGYGRVPRIAA